MNVVVFSLLTMATTGAARAEPAVGPVKDPPVKVWLNKRGPLEKGDRVRVQVRTELDGYLLVLHAEPEGRIRVLFPLDPYDDNYVRGAHDFEIRSRGDREAFRVYQASGFGTVYAAYSRDAFQVSGFVRGDHWDYLLDAWQGPEDSEAELTALVQQMALGSFDYDLVRYDVGRTVAYRGSGAYYDAYYDPYRFGSGLSFSVSFRFGRHYAPFRYRFRHAFYYSHCVDWDWYDPYYYACGPFYTAYYYRDPFFPFWYDPYFYGPAYPYYHYPSRVYVYAPYHPRVAYYDPGRFIDRRFTFKADHDEAGGSSLIGMRRRQPASGPTLRRPVATAPTRVVADDGRASGGRRVADDTRRRVPTAVSRPDVVRRPVTNAEPSVAPRRPAKPGRRGEADAAGRRPVDGTRDAVQTGRRVVPDGWGITDGARVIAPRQRGQPESPVEDGSGGAEVNRPEVDGARAPDDAVRRHPIPMTPNRDVRPAGRDAQRQVPQAGTVRRPDAGTVRRPEARPRELVRQPPPVRSPEPRRPAANEAERRTGGVERGGQRVERRTPAQLLPSRPLMRRPSLPRLRGPIQLQRPSPSATPARSIAPTRRPALRRAPVRPIRRPAAPRRKQ